MHRMPSSSFALLTSILISAFFGLATAEGAGSAANLPPSITVPALQSVGEGALLRFDVSATDPEGQPLSLRVSSLPAGATFVDHFDNTGTFSWTPDIFQSGSYLVRFIADDTFGGVDSKSVSIDVLNANAAPVLDPIGDRSVERGGMLSLWISGYDPDGDPVSFTHTGLPSFGTFTDNGDGSASMVLAPPGDEPPATTSMTVALSDGSLSASETFSITVYALVGANAPVLSAIADQAIAEGDSRSLSVSATDADLDALSWTVALPGFASLTPVSNSPGSATATLGLTPGYCAAGVYLGAISISDGALEASQSFTITVNETNRSPEWLLPVGGYTMTLAEGGMADLAVAASDPDQECGTAAPSLSLLSGSVPPSLQTSFTDQGNGAGVLHVAASYYAAGSHTLNLRARDAMDPALYADVSVQVMVQATNRAPVARAGGSYTGLVGASIGFDGSASSDPDGDALTFAWDFGDGAQATGMAASHAYAAAGHFTVHLLVSDAALAVADTTGAEVATAYEARAFTDNDRLRLFTGKPREAVYLEPVAGTFAIGDVVLSSVRLTAPQGMGPVSSIQPIQGKTVLGGDRDGNSVTEIRLEFTKDDLRSLFAYLSRTMSVNLVISADLAGGGSVQATLGAEVQPLKKGVLKRFSPNPVNPEATFTLATEKPGYLRLRIYDVTGRLVRTLLDESNVPAGEHQVRFNGRGDSGRQLASGQYFYRLESPAETAAGSLTILK